jgi:hypothetical protein
LCFGLLVEFCGSCLVFKLGAISWRATVKPSLCHKSFPMRPLPKFRQRPGRYGPRRLCKSLKMRNFRSFRCGSAFLKKVRSAAEISAGVTYVSAPMGRIFLNRPTQPFTE